MSRLPRFAPALFATLLLAAPALRAQDLTPPALAKPIADFSVPLGTTSSSVKLKKTFALQNVGAGPFVRFTTTQGTVDVQMRPDAAPQTVANFLNYVNRGAYDGSFVHRSVAGFVFQGGGFRFVNDNVETIPTDPPVANEFNLSNVRGTLAMAKLGNDPNSATDQWFFNESDGNAANLDGQNGGFTVFGSVVTNGLNTVDTIAALPTQNAGGNFNELPVVNYNGGTITSDNLVVVNTVRVAPLVAKVAGDPALLKIIVSGNSNPGLVGTAVIVGQNLVLTYVPGATGSATISLKAKDGAGSKAKASFTVTVQ